LFANQKVAIAQSFKNNCCSMGTFYLFIADFCITHIIGGAKELVVFF
jgi:hypothetical protein